MTLVRWEPSRHMMGWHGWPTNVDRLFESAFGGLDSSESNLAGSWTPAVDIVEQDGNIVLHAELAGIEAKDVDIQVENNTLTLRGERKRSTEVQDDGYRRVERRYGSFSRSFSLPSTVDQVAIRAEFDSGVLKLTLPKRAEAQPKQIPVTTAN